MSRFLVVDDDPAHVQGLGLLLEADGHEVTPFTDGGRAVHALSKGSFDAVLTDLDMPGVDGHAVVRATRETQPRACVVVVTARATEEQHTLAQAGACIISDKPINYEGVTQAVADCRLRGGPGAHGQCHMRARREEPLISLRRGP